MNPSQLVIYEKIKEMQSNKLSSINDKVINLEIALDAAILSDKERETLDDVFMELKLAIDDLAESI